MDPDAIARDLNPANPAAAAVAAGREVLRRTAEYLSQGLSFAVETTLSGRGNLDLISRGKALGYEVDLAFICVDSPQLSIKRIQNRVARGGHFVPDADVMRRYERSLAHAMIALHEANVARFFDNCGEGARLVLLARCGTIVWQADPLPNWLKL